MIRNILCVEYNKGKYILFFSGSEYKYIYKSHENIFCKSGMLFLRDSVIHYCKMFGNYNLFINRKFETPRLNKLTIEFLSEIYKHEIKNAQ